MYQIHLADKSLQLQEGKEQKVMTKLLVSIFTGSVIAFFTASSGVMQDAGLLIWLFVVFGFTLLTFKMMPAIVMFTTLLKGLVSSDPEQNRFSPLRTKNK
jgi:hypothetical protein